MGVRRRHFTPAHVSPRWSPVVMHQDADGFTIVSHRRRGAPGGRRHKPRAAARSVTEVVTAASTGTGDAERTTVGPLPPVSSASVADAVAAVQECRVGMLQRSPFLKGMYAHCTASCMQLLTVVLLTTGGTACVYSCSDVLAAVAVCCSQAAAAAAAVRESDSSCQPLQVVCYGLGSFAHSGLDAPASSSASRQQLCVLLELLQSSHCASSAFVYDPAFTTVGP